MYRWFQSILFRGDFEIRRWRQGKTKDTHSRKEREFHDAVSTSACVPFLRSVPLASIVLTPILTSFVVGLALVDGEHGGKKSRRPWLSALRISIDLVEIDLDRCEAWEQQQGLPARLSRPPSTPSSSQTSRSAKLPPASHQVQLCFRRANGEWSSSREYFMLSHQEEAQTQQARRVILSSPVSHGLTPIATDPSTCHSNDRTAP